MAVVSSVYLQAFVSEASTDKGILCRCVWSKDQEIKKNARSEREWEEEGIKTKMV